jgi:hypothetical protein
MQVALGGTGSSVGTAAVSNAGTSGVTNSAGQPGANVAAVGGTNSNNGASTSANAMATLGGGNAQAQPPAPSPWPQGAVLVTPSVNTVPIPTAAAAGFANSTWDVLMQELGPGQGLPEWLLKDPTPLLKSLMNCPSSYAVSVDGKCCGGKRTAAAACSTNGSKHPRDWHQVQQ